MFCNAAKNLYEDTLKKNTVEKVSIIIIFYYVEYWSWYNKTSESFNEKFKEKKILLLDLVIFLIIDNIYVFLNLLR